uniref:Ribosome-inactivating protein lychnin n=1 Tax=Silene chalcedonica TaxID=39855 RepID=RIPLY_SILCH|nr:RecName: Full=Ribosome-inactivating protein lychnin [Silene chalcedonica]2G5X_A Chain A, Ribosome-inactivating protein [Silene chalcedonica]
RPSWTVDSDSAKYSSFLDSLREEFGRGTPKVCNIPVTKKANNDKFVLVNLVLPFNRNTITLAFRASDAYLVGFQDRDSKTNKLRANFFSDEYRALSGKYKSIFTDAEVLAPALPCASTYTDLQNKAGVSREKLSLGVSSLQTAFTAVYGKVFTGKNVAKFALISIQMVAEAARFKYIEDQVINRGMYSSFEAGARITLLENNWSKISEQYHKSCKLGGGQFTEEEMKLGLLLYN